jgi:hypothetical protein
MLKPSPLPWKRGTDGLIFDADNEYVTDTCGTSLPAGEENQKLIVRAVNCHDQLVEACEDLIALVYEVSAPDSERAQLPIREPGENRARHYAAEMLIAKIKTAQ